ncbi:MAG: hypothetical protein VXW25_03745, partial [Pseudomonadota bacterium]|nr:hypothetical protein [Pseudomonadota bacterium]
MANAFIQEKELFPIQPPFDSGMMDRGLHKIYFEQCGRADGRAVLFLHGGPGAGISATHRRLFNPDRFRCVLFDQRGVGSICQHDIELAISSIGAAPLTMDEAGALIAALDGDKDGE